MTVTKSNSSSPELKTVEYEWIYPPNLGLNNRSGVWSMKLYDTSHEAIMARFQEIHPGKILAHYKVIERRWIR